MFITLPIVRYFCHFSCHTVIATISQLLYRYTDTYVLLSIQQLSFASMLSSCQLSFLLIAYYSSIQLLVSWKAIVDRSTPSVVDIRMLDRPLVDQHLWPGTRIVYVVTFLTHEDTMWSHSRFGVLTDRYDQRPARPVKLIRRTPDSFAFHP